MWTTVRQAIPEPVDQFVSDLGDDSASGDALIYIHGYQNSFESAAEVAATLKHDLHFEGPVILYSWPSTDELLNYTADLTNVRWTVQTLHFSTFMKTVLNTPGIKRVHIIAHSMGSQPLDDELSRNGLANTLGQIVFVAPDEDSNTLQSLLNRLIFRPDQLSIYASRWDSALRMSEFVNKMPRAGQMVTGLSVPKLDTIDASDVDTVFLGHSYYVGVGRVEGDIDRVLQGQAPPRPHLQPNGQAWKLLP